LPREQTPLLPKGKGNIPIQSVRTIRKIVQVCIDRTIQKLIALGQIEEADSLLASTVHWFRHTGISDDVMERPREHVRDDAGHYSSATTDKYINVEMRERHKSAKHKHEKNNANSKGKLS
jgi:glycyl-tRNA synthetase (class II)